MGKAEFRQYSVKNVTISMCFQEMVVLQHVKLNLAGLALVNQAFVPQSVETEKFLVLRYAMMEVKIAMDVIPHVLAIKVSGSVQEGIRQALQLVNFAETGRERKMKLVTMDLMMKKDVHQIV